MAWLDIPSGQLLRAFLGTSVVLALAAAPYGAVVMLGFLALWALLGAERAIQALALTSIVRFLNPSLFSTGGPVVLLGWLVFGAASMRVVVETALTSTRMHPLLPALLSFCTVVLLESTVASRFPLFSILKLVAFTGLGTTVLQAFALSARRGVRWDAWFVGVWLAVFVMSVPTHFFPSVGYNLNGSGFQGILSHPQTLGTIVAPGAAWFAATLLSRKQPSAVYAAALALALTLIYLSGARTAALALILGISLTAPMFLARRSDATRAAKRTVQGGAAILLGALVTIQAAGLANVGERARSFVLKYNPSSSLSANNTRAEVIHGHLKSFAESPVLGIGFGVSANKLFRPSNDITQGTPLSAPVEKGFLPTAILEEIGVVGAVAFVALLFGPLLWHVLRGGDVVRAAVAFTVLALNLGEMFFFSVGGFGMFAWLLLGWATTAEQEPRHPPASSEPI